MRVINSQNGRIGPVSFLIGVDTASEYYCNLVLSGVNEARFLKCMPGDVSVEMAESVVSIGVRYTFFKDFIDAFVNSAIIIKYHGYTASPDLSTLTITDHLKSHSGRDTIFSDIKFKVTFKFQK